MLALAKWLQKNFSKWSSPSLVELVLASTLKHSLIAHWRNWMQWALQQLQNQHQHEQQFTIAVQLKKNCKYNINCIHIHVKQSINYRSSNSIIISSNKFFTWYRCKGGMIRASSNIEKNRQLMEWNLTLHSILCWIILFVVKCNKSWQDMKVSNILIIHVLDDVDYTIELLLQHSNNSK